MSLLQEKLEIKAAETQWFLSGLVSGLPPALKWLLAVMIVAIIPAYYLTKAVSHGYYGSRYKDSLVAAQAAFSNPLPPVVGTSTLTTIGNGMYAAAAPIANPNLELSAKQVSYEFKFYNEQGQQVASVKDSTFLLPNQNKFLAVPRLQSAQDIQSADVAVSPDIAWQKRLNVPAVQLVAPQPSVYNQPEPLALVAEGYFQNNSPYQLGRVRLTFILYNAQNRIVAVSQRDEFAVAPFERRAYKQLWPGVYNGSVSRSAVLAETNTLDASNITLPSQNSPASDLGR